MKVRIEPADPQGAAALALLAEAAREVHALYPEFVVAGAPPPGNAPTPPRGIYLLAWLDGEAVASAALRPLDEATGEVRRLYVAPSARRAGLARALLARVEVEARGFGYRVLRLETGHRQPAALALYAACGWVRIEPFGPYRNDPTSVCFEKPLAATARSED
jgi:GNAT superfamily N-acetyltransferase